MNKMKCNISGIVKNLPSFHREALLPVFEAVINSIQAIEDQGILTDGHIEVQILRDKQQELIKDSKLLPIDGFKIIDNGVGFNHENFNSFQTSFSAHKQPRGGKGIGRFLWLKAFQNINIESVYSKNDKNYKRIFSFSLDKGVDQYHEEVTTEKNRTVVTLSGFKGEYSNLPSAYKTTKKIAQRILEHCLVYFVTDDVPNVEIIDQECTINLNEMYALDIKAHTKKEYVKIKKHDFHFIHLKLYDTHDKAHSAVLCANKRDVKNIDISKKLTATAQFDEDNKKFIYAVYISSSYLDEAVDLSRQSFDILPETQPLFPDELSFKEIENTISRVAKEFLKPFLDKIRNQKRERVQRYISDVNPALRCILNYCPELLDDIQPNIIDEKLSEVLYQYKGKAEHKLKDNTKNLLKTQIKSMAELDDKCKKLTGQLNDFQKDDLVSYIFRRKSIIELLEKKLECNENGKYSNEDIIHDIIFPRGTTTDELLYEDHNLWLIDECLVFHSFAASDQELKQFTSSDNRDRPDIVAFADLDDERIARAVSIIELKKPQRKDFDEDPVKQIYRYLKKIRDSRRVKLPNGRDLHVNQSTRYYCYAICDINDAVRNYIECNGNYSQLKDGLGYFYYNNNFHAHTEILHFDKIVADAKRRHSTFFEKLGIN